MSGFTLIEILITVSLISILGFFLFSIGLNFYKSQQLETQAQEILQTLRRAQSKAMAIELDSTFGVYLTDDNYTLFKGTSYATRDVQYDEVFDLPQIINVSGLSEVVFSKVEGIPNGVAAHCAGVCTPCSNLNNAQCPQQQGCRWRRGRCQDNPGCISCDVLDQISCGSSIDEPQYGCVWQPEIRGGDIILNIDDKIKTVNINEIGRINLEL